MRKALFVLASLGLTALSALLVGVYFNRRALPYNETGRYFDPAEAVVYEQQAVSVYGLLALLSGVLALLALWFTYRNWNAK